MNDVKTLLTSLVDSVPHQAALTAFLILFAALVLRKLLLYFLDRRWHDLIGKGRSDMDDLLLKALRKPVGAAILLIGAYFAIVNFAPSPQVREGIDTATLILVILLFSWFAIRCIGVLSSLGLARAAQNNSPLLKQTIPLADRSAKGVVSLVAALVILQNMGVSITGIIASLGLGGLAVARIQKLLDDHPRVSEQSLPFHATMTPLVRFTDFGAYAREIMVYYFTVPIEWTAYLEVREEINLEIMELLEEMDLAIAYPTQVVDVRGGDVERLLGGERPD